MAKKWDTRRKTSKVDWDNVDIPKLVYGIVCVALVIAAIIYSVITGTAPNNEGF